MAVVRAVYLTDCVGSGLYGDCIVGKDPTSEPVDYFATTIKLKVMLAEDPCNLHSLPASLPINSTGEVYLPEVRTTSGDPEMADVCRRATSLVNSPSSAARAERIFVADVYFDATAASLGSVAAIEQTD